MTPRTDSLYRHLAQTVFTAPRADSLYRRLVQTVFTDTACGQPLTITLQNIVICAPIRPVFTVEQPLTSL